MSQAANEEQQRAAVAQAIAQVQQLRTVALATLPDRSRGRRKIVDACDRALSAAGTAIRGMQLGDEPGILQRAWRAAVDAAKEAYEYGERTVREVASATEETLKRLWNVTVEKVREIKDLVAQKLAAAVQAVKDAVTAAYQYLAEQVGTKIGAAVLLLGLVALYLFRPSKN